MWQVIINHGNQVLYHRDGKPGIERVDGFASQRAAFDWLNESGVRAVAKSVTVKRQKPMKEVSR